MSISMAVGPPASVEPGTEFSILAITTGGDMPYEATPAVAVDKGVKYEAAVNQQGVINIKFTVPKDAQPGPIPFEVTVDYKTGKTASLKSEINVVAKPGAGDANKTDAKKNADVKK